MMQEAGKSKTMKVAYADPPYVGLANLYPERTEVDHADLIDRLVGEYDGWSLSCHTPSLRLLLPMCPKEVRVGAWLKPFCSFKPGVQPAYAWEPVLFMPARGADRTKETVRDWIACAITLQKGLIGAKPARFCFWLFEIMRAEPGDEFDDLYPGTGIVSRCWQNWCDMKRQEQSTFLPEK